MSDTAVLQQILRKHVEKIKSDACAPLPRSREPLRAGLWGIVGRVVSAVLLQNCCLLTWRSADRAVACGPRLTSSIFSAAPASRLFQFPVVDLG